MELEIPDIQSVSVGAFRFPHGYMAVEGPAVTPEDTSMLWIAATRYYLGRTSYAVSGYCKLLRQEWLRLPAHVQHIIRRDIEEEFARDDLTRAHRS